MKLTHVEALQWQGRASKPPKVETIIVGQLFAGLDATQSINPNVLAYDPRLTVRHTAMIKEAGRIPGHTAINIVVLIESKERGITLLEFGQPLRFGELGANILDNPLPLSQVHPGKAAHPMDAGGLKYDEGMIQ
jgi:hypothetical protein